MLPIIVHGRARRTVARLAEALDVSDSDALACALALLNLVEPVLNNGGHLYLMHPDDLVTELTLNEGAA